MLKCRTSLFFPLWLKKSWKGSHLHFSLMKNHIFIEFRLLLVMPTGESARGFRWSLDPFDLESRGWGTGHIILIWRRWYGITFICSLIFLQPETLLAIFVQYQIWFFPQTNLWSHLLGERTGPAKERVANCSVSQRLPASPLLHLLQTAAEKQDFQMLTPESCREPEGETAFLIALHTHSL